MSETTYLLNIMIYFEYYEFFLFLDKVCKRPWNFERVPNAMIQGHDRALIFTSTKEACLAACLNEVRLYYIK